MIVQRTLPPIAAPRFLRDVICGLHGVYWAQWGLHRRKAELGFDFRSLEQSLDQDAL